MFYTLPSAEMPAPFAAQGEKSWSWLEIAIRVPLFLVSIRQRVQEAENQEAYVSRDFLLSKVEQVLEIFNQRSESLKISEVQMLTPGYLNPKQEQTRFQLKTIRQIWKHANSPGHTFVLLNGERISNSSKKVRKMDLVLNLDYKA